MTWEPEIDELKRRKEFARRMGGEEGVARQRKRGKLTVRERVDLFADPGSFREFGILSGEGIYDGTELVDFTPKPAVHGMCTLDGRKIVLTGGDFTVRGGSGGGASAISSWIISRGTASESARGVSLDSARASSCGTSSD